MLSLLGSFCLILGGLGLLLPFMPGFLFLLIAAACFASLSPGLRRHFERHPRMRRFFHRLDNGAHLHMGDRARLAFWAALETVLPNRNR